MWKINNNLSDSKETRHYYWQIAHEDWELFKPYLSCVFGALMVHFQCEIIAENSDMIDPRTGASVGRLVHPHRNVA